jgi:hypothetical protein
MRLSAACLVALALGFVHSAAPRGASPNVVISQVYGAGGNSGALYSADYIELFNRGNTPVSLAGWSLQYASATGTGNLGANSGQLTELPNVTLQPGQYFLVQQATGANGAPLPTADLVDPTPIGMAAGAGKVALASIATSLGCNGGSVPCSAAQLAPIVDLVGYGTANFFEGSGPAPVISTILADFRAGAGCTDTDDNAADFAAAGPAPRNSSTALNVCDGPPPVPSLSVDDVMVAEGNAGSTSAIFTVTLSSPAPDGGVSFDIATTDGSATLADGDYGAAALTGQVIPAGATSYAFTVFVNGDTTIEPDETFTVTIGSVSGANLGDATGLGTILNDDFLATTIPGIQGGGLATALAGQPVTTSGIVTGVKANGFFIQSAPDADANPDTSEGLFVFTSTTPAVTPGDLVNVSGTAGEFFDLTQIESRRPENVVVQSSGHPLPEAVALTTSILDRKGTPAQLERFEGMRVTGALTSVAPTNGFGEIYTVLTGVKRPRREPGIEAGLPVPPDPETGLHDCCVPVWDLNPERLMIDTDGLLGSSALWVTSNVSFDVAGPLDFTFDNYKVLPTNALVPSPNMTAVPVPAPAADEFSVAGYNIENFSGSTTQKRKAALNIRTVMRSPDVIGLVEIASLSALQSLAAQVNADTVAAGDPDPQYVARLVPFGTNTQHVGFLVKTSRVSIATVTQARTTDTFVNPVTGLPETLHDRPPLVLEGTVDPDADAPARIIVVVNHLRSFIDIERLDGEGIRVRAKRKAQAEAIAELLQELQSNNPATPVISVGDYNAYEFSDGYTDPIAVITGHPTPGDEIVVGASPDLVNPNFVNLTDSLPQAERYSFIFEGTPQALDHILVNRTAQAWLQRYAVARSNADFPDDGRAGYRTNAARPEAHSDHDAPVAHFRVTGKSGSQR